MPYASLIVKGSMQHPTVRLIRGAMAVQGDAVDGPEGHLKLRGSRVEHHHPLGQQGHPVAVLAYHVAVVNQQPHPLAGHGDHDRTLFQINIII